MINWCGIRILITSVIPGAPWSEETLQEEIQYKQSIEADRAPKEIPYKWNAQKMLKRKLQQPKRPVAITPSELMQLSMGKPEYVLRIRFRMWKNQVLGVQLYRFNRLLQRDAEVLYALRDVGPYNYILPRIQKNEKNQSNPKNQKNTFNDPGDPKSLEIFERTTMGLDREIEIIRGSDCRYYVQSCSSLLPPMAPLPVLAVIANQKRKQLEAISTKHSTEDLKKTKNMVEEKNEQKPKVIQLPSLPFQLPIIYMVGKIIPVKYSEAETLINIPWMSLCNPTELIVFVESVIGKCSDTGGFIETRNKDLMFWTGTTKVTEANRRASIYAERELKGNALLLPQYTAWHARHRWRDESLPWRKKHLTWLHPDVFRYPVVESEEEEDSSSYKNKKKQKKIKKKRKMSVSPQRRGSANNNLSDLGEPKTPASIEASKILTTETLMFLEQAIQNVIQELESLYCPQHKKKNNKKKKRNGDSHNSKKSSPRRKQSPREEVTDVGSIAPYNITYTFHKHGLPLRYLGLVRVKTTSLFIKDILLEEATARSFKRIYNTKMRNLPCFVSDHTSEDPTKHLGKMKSGTDQEDDLFNWFEHHQYKTITAIFNLLLGHVEKGKEKEEWPMKQKIALCITFPSLLTNVELKKTDLYSNILRNDVSRIRMFKRAQILTGVLFFRHLSGNKVLKAQYIETMNAIIKYPKRIFKCIQGDHAITTTLERLNNKRKTLELSLGNTHSLHLQVLSRIANVHSVSSSGLMTAERLYRQAKDLAKEGHGTSSSTYVNQLIHLGEFLTKIGKFHQAIVPLNLARKALDNATGVQLASVLIAIGKCSIGLGTVVTEGKAAIEKAKQIMDDVFGYGKVEIIKSYLLYAQLMCLIGDNGAAEEIIAKAQDTCQCSLGSHPDHALCFQMRSLHGLSTGTYTKCLFDLKTTHLMYQDTLGSTSLECMQTGVARARVELRLGMYVEMLKSIAGAKEICCSRLGMDNYFFAEILVLYAQYYIGIGNYALGGDAIADAHELLTALFTVTKEVTINETDDAIANAIHAIRTDLSPKSRTKASGKSFTEVNNTNGVSPLTQRIITPLDCELLMLRASVHLDFGRMEESEKDLMHAKKHVESCYGHSPKLGDVLLELAKLRLYQGKLELSESLCENALYCYRNLENQHTDPRIGRAKCELGHAQSSLANYDSAKLHIIDGLNILKTACGKSHIDVARGQMILGEMYINIREDTLAKNELLNAVSIIEQVHGTDHLYVCRAEGILSRSLANLCHFPEATQRLEHSDSHYVNFMRNGDGKGSTYDVNTNLGHVSIIVDFACLHYEQANYDDTYSLLMRAMPLARVLVGKEHPVTQRILQMMGRLHLCLANFQQAHDSFETSQTLARNLYGTHHPNVFRASLCDCQVYLIQADYVQTHVRLNELKLFEPLPSPVDSANLRMLEGEYMLCMGKYKTSVDIFMSALSILNARYSKPITIVPSIRQPVELHLLCAWCACRVGNALMEWERWADAESILASARDVFATFDVRRAHPQLADIVWRHALCLHRLGQNVADLGTSNTIEVTGTMKKYKTEIFIHSNGKERARAKTYRRIDRIDNDVCRDEFILAKQILDDSLGPNHPRFADLACALAEFHSKGGLDLWSKKLYEQACSVRNKSFGRIHPKTASALIGLSKTYKDMSQWEKMSNCANDAKWIWEQLNVLPSKTNKNKTNSNGKKIREQMEERPEGADQCEVMISNCLKYHLYRYEALFCSAYALGRTGSDTMTVGIETMHEILISMEKKHLDWTQLYQNALFEKETLSFREKSVRRFAIHGDDPHDLVKEGAAPIVEHTHEYYRQRQTR